jgi:hypothetical protein
MTHVASVYLKYFRCFRGMFQLCSHGCSNVDQDVAYVAMVVHVRLQVYVPVTEPTNYTKLSKKISTGADNLANLSPYNPVVQKSQRISNQPTYKPRSYKFSSHSHILHKVRNTISNTSEFRI